MSPSVADNIDSYELSPDQHKAVYEQSLEFEGQAPPKEAKEDLVRTHNTNLELGKKAQNFGRRFTLPAAYSPSNASLDTLQKVFQSYFYTYPSLLIHMIRFHYPISKSELTIEDVSSRQELLLPRTTPPT